MRIVVAVMATSLAAFAVEAQTIRMNPGAQYMPLRMFDATGKLMGGTVADTQAPSFPQLAVTFRYHSPIATASGETFTLRVEPDASGPHLRYRWTQFGSDLFFFESNDCTGQPYVEARNPLPGRRMALLDYEFNVLYLSEPDPAIVTRIYHSFRYPQQACTVNAGPGNFQAVEIAPVIDMDDIFTLPFRVN
jgi:hypothetical protein